MSKKKTGTFTKKGSPERRKTAPPTQVHKKGKGAGSYDRKKEKDTFDESTEIGNFVEAIMEKNYAEAYKYLSSVVESKLQARIAKEVSTPLF
jgi:hypothetical protein